MQPAGWYLPEAAHPAYTLSSDFNLDSASPKGGLAPISPDSVESYRDEESVKFLSDPEMKRLFTDTKKIKDVKVEDYVAIFVVGGVGIFG